MKKVVNSVLASALAASFVPAVVGAEEATTAPAMDPALEKVVKRLEAIGLVAGYGNGEYGVERNINRAEFATLVVRARGLEEASKLAQFQANFADVKASDWFAGFVNVATTQDIVKGYADKTFKPANNVTYAEAVAMIIRALGYEPTVKGAWPNNYIAKASELGISTGIKFEPNKPATRGDIFLMLDNALRVDLMEQKEFGAGGDHAYEVKKNETLLTEYLGVQVRDMDWANEENNDSGDLPFVTNVPVVGLGVLKANEVELDVRKADLAGGGNAGRMKFKVADGINPNDYAGQHVQVWIKDAKEDVIVWMEASEDEEVQNTRFDTVYVNDKEYKGGEVSDIDDVEILFENGKTYKFASNAVVTYNFTRGAAKSMLNEALKVYDAGFLPFAKVVLDEAGEISYIHIIDDVTLDQTDKGVKYGSEVIEKVDAAKQRIRNLEDNTLELTGTEGTDFLVFLNGKPAKLADLQPMDVYSVYYADGKKDKPLVFAVRNVVEGKVDDVEVRRGTDNRLKIGDKTYRFRGGSTFSDNGNKDITKLNQSDEAHQELIRDLDGETVKVYLDAAGRIRHIETKDNLSDRRFDAIVTKAAAYDAKDDEYTFSVLGNKGQKKSISIEAEDIKLNGSRINEDLIEDVLTPPTKDSETLYVLEVRLDANGDAEEVNIREIESGDEGEEGKFFTLVGEDWEKAADEDEDTLEIGRKSYDVTDDTAVWDITKGLDERRTRAELDDPAVVKFDRVADDEDKTAFVVVDEHDVEYIFLVDGDSANSDTQYGLVKSMNKSGGVDTVTMLVKDGDKFTEKKFNLDGDVDDAEEKFQRLDFISFNLNADDEVVIDETQVIVDDIDLLETVVNNDEDTLEAADLERATVARVDRVKGNEIQWRADDDTTYEYLVNANTIFFNDDFEQVDGVNDGDYIVLIETDDDGNRFDYVLVLGDEDDAEEAYTDEELEELLEAFFGQSDEDDIPTDDPTGEPGDDVVDVEKIEVEKVLMPGLYGARVRGAAGAVDTDKVATLKLIVGDLDFTVPVNADGSFRFTTDQFVTEDFDTVEFEAYDADGELIDTYEDEVNE